MDTHSKGLTGATLKVLDLKRGSYGFFSARPSNKLAEKEGTSLIYKLYCLAEYQREGARTDFGGKRALSGQRCGATRSDGAGLPPRFLASPWQPQSINRLSLPARVFRAGRGRGEWGQVVFSKAVR